MNPLTLVKRIQKINSREAALGISEEASWHAKYKDSAYVFVGGIPFDLTEGDLLAVFAQYGEIVDVNLVRDKGTGKSKGFAFVAYEDQRSTILAVDNLNGAQILGRIIRVDHVSKYKKKEEEDEEAEQQKREARGVCRAFQRGECTRGASCKFSHDEQRAANTGWGSEGPSSRWEHDKFEHPKKGHDKDPHAGERGKRGKFESHPREGVRREEKRRNDHEEDQSRIEDKSLRRRDDDEFEFKSREDQYKREDKSWRRNDDDDGFMSRKDYDKRDGKKSRKDEEYEPKLREHGDRREGKSSRKGEEDRREDKRLRKEEEDRREHKRLRQGEDDDGREDKRLRNDEADYEPKLRKDGERREGEKWRRHHSESYIWESQDRRRDRDSFPYPQR